MKQLFIFIGGMVVGALLLYLVLYSTNKRAENSDVEKLRSQLIEVISQGLTATSKEAEIQYVEVKGKKGIATLHTEMMKDSVQILLGKPDDVSLQTFSNSTHETWGYKINNKYGLPRNIQNPDLTIEFTNGKLKSVRQE